ncbi:hypothetical protein PICMEDRAFT_17725 [Pichia membranifaciens NRRL Y-2026]|uniref:Uncharacterized protein n=1 Tax=Pichia membranifaciens NRRL Y-2026 TaxID=763406 RepID=A0A1E3NGI9_9ASCO|nr:hypothetical protein PICMEDRAFT_17725 [Pichia membranifaciens NRRL Y-2026]ODQ45229.1 hypothetical protein PICMEDRAFT_17725 [Pichia membranifaciens NRRL Y-2026]
MHTYQNESLKSPYLIKPSVTLRYSISAIIVLRYNWMFLSLQLLERLEMTLRCRSTCLT